MCINLCYYLPTLDDDATFDDVMSILGNVKPDDENMQPPQNFDGNPPPEKPNSGQ